MAVANTKATAISNADSDPVVLNDSILEHGLVRECSGTVETAAGDDDGSVFRFCRVPSNARITSIKYACDAITGGTSFDLGVYDTADNGGAVVDADEFASALDLGNATAWTEVINEAAATELADCEKPLWEKLGLTEDPKKSYDICMTSNTQGSGAASIAVKVQYVL